ncbi:MAG TPA: mechanosensitive ion channel family protein [Pyrinomonadaceae bacterium]|nr:mechanosensitive ion channel family protein [Pyrinomonadaceae bacterium]
MTFWQQVQIAAGLGSALLWTIVLFVLAALVLNALRPAERMRIRAALILFGLAILGLFVNAFLALRGVSPASALYLWFRWASLFCLGIAFINVASVFLFEVFLSSLRLKPPRIMRDLLVAFAYVVLGITLLSIPKVDITGIVATSAVLTAVIGLSFQDTLGNMMGGMALQLEHSIGIGDWIRIDGQEGLIRDIRWRHTAIETRNWDTVVIPNSILMKSQVTVLGRRLGAPRQHRQWVYFNVDFRYSPAEVIEAVETGLRAEPIPNIAADPLPNCVFMDFKDSYGNYAVRYWLTDFALDDPTNSIVRTRIYFALQRAGIPLSIPAHSIFLTEEDAARQESKTAKDIEKRVQALQRVELLNPLTEDERRSLAPRLRYAPFARGEAMTRQGAKAHWLYLITKGDAEVRVAADGNLNERIATLHQGDVFGEMGMMTGEPRTATVIALTDVECYRLDKDAFYDVLQSRPEIADEISVLLAKRRVELESAREDLNEEATRNRMRYHQNDLLRRIKSFFTL